LTYQWQISTNGGSGWANVTNGGSYSGAQTTTLTINPATLSMNGYEYRCAVTDAAGTVDSQSGTLNTSGGGGGDTPLPLWAIAALAVLLFGTGQWFLAKKRRFA